MIQFSWYLEEKAKTLGIEIGALFSVAGGEESECIKKEHDHTFR